MNLVKSYPRACLLMMMIILCTGCAVSKDLYNREAARDYAYLWWNSCNHAPCGNYRACVPWSFWGWENCCGYQSHGGDCANFVSQALRAGGHPSFNGGLPCRGYPCGQEEIGAKNLGDCLVQHGWFRTCGYKQPPPENIQIGDVLIYHANSCNDYSAHATIITAVNASEVKITCHSSNQKDKSYTYLSTIKPYYEWLHYKNPRLNQE